MNSTIDEKYRYFVEYIETGIEGIRRTGIRVLECRPNFLKLLMPLEGNTNHIGIMYAGSLFTIGEISGGAVFGVAFDYTKYIPIVKEVNIRFRRPVVTDVTLDITMDQEKADAIQRETDRNGKADFTMDLEIKDAGGETVAKVHGIWQCRLIPEGMKNPLVKE